MGSGLLRHLTSWFRGLNFSSMGYSLQKPMEVFSLTFVLTASLAIYLYGVVWILPLVLNEQPISIQTIAFVAATWCLLGIWTNLFLIRFRDTSIRHRFLSQPVVMSQPTLNGNLEYNNGRSDENLVRDRKQVDQIKNLGQQFMLSPFGSETAWHICGTCEVYVPPRAWHCPTCNICILRRDHHCIFAMTCIGEDNHINFLGLLLYLAIGATYAIHVSMLYSLYLFDVPPLWFILKTFFSWYVILFDFSIVNMLSSIALLGGLISWAIFTYYLLLALQNQTSADRTRGIKRSLTGVRQYSYVNLKAFLGPNPILRILWPLSRVLKTDYGAVNQSSKLENNLKIV